MSIILRIKLFALLGAPLLLASSLPAEACSLILQIPSVIYLGSNQPYDPTGMTPELSAHALQISTIDKNTCQFFVAASEDTPGGSFRNLSGPQGILTYQIHTSSTGNTIWRDIPLATPSEVLRGVLNNTTPSMSLNFWASIPSGQWPAPGTYSKLIRVSLYSGSPESANPALVSTQLVTLKKDVMATVVPQINAGSGYMALGGSKSVLDFGNISPGAIRTFELSYRANTPVEISIESLNKGQLVNANSEHATPIPYTMVIGGQAISLATPSAINFQASNNIARTQTGIITLGNIERLLAGNYRDEIMLTVKAQ